MVAPLPRRALGVVGHHVGLEPDDRRDAALGGLAVELDRPAHHPVVRERDRAAGPSPRPGRAAARSCRPRPGPSSRSGRGGGRRAGPRRPASKAQATRGHGARQGTVHARCGGSVCPHRAAMGGGGHPVRLSRGIGRPAGRRRARSDPAGRGPPHPPRPARQPGQPAAGCRTTRTRAVIGAASRSSHQVPSAVPSCRTDPATRPGRGGEAAPVVLRDEPRPVRMGQQHVVVLGQEPGRRRRRRDRDAARRAGRTAPSPARPGTRGAPAGAARRPRGGP